MGWGSERPCSQVRPGEGFAAQQNFFSSYFYKILDSKKALLEKDAFT